MSILSIDFETASTVDLRKAGATAYAVSPDTMVLCMAWAFDDEPVQLWAKGNPFPQRVLDHVGSGGMVRAWNAAFEHDIWNHTLCRGSRPALHAHQLDDTMARAAYWGLPLSLADAGAALGLPIQKDMAGHALMLRMCRPRGWDCNDRPTWWHEDDPAKFAALCNYCGNDVLAERLIARNLPPLPGRELRIWRMDRGINQRGVAIDQPLANRLRDLTTDVTLELNRRMKAATQGDVTSCKQTEKLMNWLWWRGYDGPDLSRPVLYEALKDPALKPVLRGPIWLRREAARSSTAKLTVLEAANVGGRMYGLLQYYGASRTGRWAGRLFQPQNIPRPTVKVDDALAAIEAGATYRDLDLLFEDSAMGVVSSCLRACLVAAPGKTLVSADLSQIEARVVAWLAGQDDVLDVFRRGEDVYTYTAHKIGSTDRQFGKVLVLACGFGMGPEKFRATAKTYRVMLDEKQAVAAVAAWRAANPKIVKLWWDCDAAAKVIAGGGTGPLQVRGMVFARRKNTMIVTLPSGRDLVYRGVEMMDDEEGRPSITFLGVNQITKQWGRGRTYGGKIVENIVQAIARDIMADAMLELEGRDVPLVLSVHDEIVAEVPRRDGARVLDLMLDTMRKGSPWTNGLPIDAAGWSGPRYRKG